MGKWNGQRLAHPLNSTFCWSAVTSAFFELALNNVVTLKSRLGVTQGHTVIGNGTIRKLECGFLNIAEYLRNG